MIAVSASAAGLLPGPAGAALLQQQSLPALAQATTPDTVATGGSAATPARRDTSATAARKADGTLQVGIGTVRFGGLIQAWYLDGDGDAPRSFRMRRAMLTFKGELSASARWTLSVDPAKALKLSHSYADVGGTRAVSGTSANQSTLLLQDAFLSVTRGRLRVDVGQFRIPVGYEGSALSSAQLETVERAMFASVGKLTQMRDLGAAAHMTLFARATATVGVFNGLGESQNSADGNPEKALVGRLVLRTPLAGLQLGTSGAWGGEQEDASRRRTAVEATYTAGALQLRAEAMRAHDGSLRKLGYYGLAAYRRGRLQGVLRYDVWNPDRAAGLAVREALVGFNYFLPDAPVKLQANYLHQDAAAGGPGRDVLLMSLQAAW